MHEHPPTPTHIHTTILCLLFWLHFAIAVCTVNVTESKAVLHIHYIEALLRENVQYAHAMVFSA